MKKKWSDAVSNWFGKIVCAVLVMAFIVAGGFGGACSLGEMVIEPNEPEVLPLLPENAVEAGIPVETEYATFHFPVEYAGKLQFTLIESEEGTMMFATTMVGETEVELYFVALGMIEMDGVCLGRLQDDAAGELSIYLMLVELEMEGLNEEEMSRLYELQESVNVILDQLMEDPRYVAE